MYVCICNAIKESDVKQYSSVKDVKMCTEAGTCCGRCLPVIKQIVSENKNG